MSGAHRTAISLSPEAGEPAAVFLERLRAAEALGYESAWVSQRADAPDAVGLLTAGAAVTARIGLGTAVLPIHGRHPVLAAQAALTLDELSGGRFRLGLGVSHGSTVEGVLRLPGTPVVEPLREYLTIVREATAEGLVAFAGRWFGATWAYGGEPRPNLPILVGALGPRSLQLAGELADGVVLWLCTPDLIRSHVVPNVAAGRARRGLGLEGFEIAASVLITLTDERDAARAAHAAMIREYARLPNYARMLRRSGFGRQLDAGDADPVLVDALAAIGPAEAIHDRIRRYRDAGCTLPLVAPHCGTAFASDWSATAGAAAPA